MLHSMLLSMGQGEWTSFEHCKKRKKKDKEKLECFCFALARPPWGGYSVEEQVIYRDRLKEERDGQFVIDECPPQ